MSNTNSNNSRRTGLILRGEKEGVKKIAEVLSQFQTAVNNVQYHIERCTADDACIERLEWLDSSIQTLTHLTQDNLHRALGATLLHVHSTSTTAAQICFAIALIRRGYNAHPHFWVTQPHKLPEGVKDFSVFDTICDEAEKDLLYLCNFTSEHHLEVLSNTGFVSMTSRPLLENALFRYLTTHNAHNSRLSVCQKVYDLIKFTTHLNDKRHDLKEQFLTVTINVQNQLSKDAAAAAEAAQAHNAVAHNAQAPDQLQLEALTAKIAELEFKLAELTAELKAHQQQTKL